MAIVSVIALLVALGFAALISLQPWAVNSVAPQLSVAPGLGIALGDSVAVSPGRQLAVAPAQAATGGKPRFVAGGVAGEGGESQPRLDIAAARAVTNLQPRAPSEGSPESEPPPVTSPPAQQPPPPPAAAPVAAAVPDPAVEPVAAKPTTAVTGGHSPGPIGAGEGPVEGPAAEAVEVHEGDEYAFSFSFYIEPTVYLSPGSENLIMRFKGAAGEIPSFGLQLWDDGSGTQRGLWGSGDAIGGERFLAPVAEGVWHEAVVYFQASSEGDGFYLLTLDGQPIDARAWVSLIESENDSTLIETGLFREGERVIGAPDVLFGPTQLGETVEPVLP